MAAFVAASPAHGHICVLKVSAQCDILIVCYLNVFEKVICIHLVKHCPVSMQMRLIAKEKAIRANSQTH